MPTKKFKGVIKLDVRDSKPDWTPYELPKRARRARRTCSIVLYDDTGLAAWSPFGGRINMPTLQRLADNGLTYSQWHTTALCSPTRSTFLTGRNHHLNGFASITEGADGFPGAAARTPAECATIGAGAAGQRLEHVLGRQEPQRARSTTSPAAAAKTEWPLQKGFDRFYGFLGGETNNWYPDLVEDNHYIDQPYTPEDGYHLSKDLADQALQMLRDSSSRRTRPSRGSCGSAPAPTTRRTTRPKEYIDKYKGKFDDGYEAYREWVLPRMIEKGILPEGHRADADQPDARRTSPTRPADAVRPWDTLNADEKKLFSRMAEVYAGFSEYTDAQVGRIVDYLEETGPARQHDHLLLRRQRRVRRRQPERLGQREQVLQRLPGRPRGEPEDSTSSAARTPTTTIRPAGRWRSRTPFQMFKRYSQYPGGTCDPLVIHWPKGIKAKGEVRHQYHHSTDIVPTILDVVGLEMPKVYRGVEQYPLTGVSMRYTFDDAEGADARRSAQYYAMLGTRGIWQDGWKAVGAARADQRRGPLRQGPLGAVPHRRGPLRVARPRGGAPREAQGARSTPGSRRPTRTTCCRSTIGRRSSSSRIAASAARSRRATRYIYYPDTSPVPEARRGQHPRPFVQDPRRRRTHVRRARRDLRARLALRRPRAVHQGPEAVLRLQLPRHPAGAEVRRPEPLTPGKHTLGVAFVREKSGQARRVDRHDAALRRRQGRGRGPDADADRALHARAATACASATTAPTRSARSTRRRTPSPTARSSASPSTSSNEVYLDLEKEAVAAFARD